MDFFKHFDEKQMYNFYSILLEGLCHCTLITKSLYPKKTSIKFDSLATSPKKSKTLPGGPFVHPAIKIPFQEKCNMYYVFYISRNWQHEEV
jgi:hypothetical protein